jgi:membrane carboxypeptidase/penicillin-binding protein
MTAIKSFNEVSFDELMDIAAGGRGFYVESDDDGWEAGYEDDHIHVYVGYDNDRGLYGGATGQSRSRSN